MDLTLIEHDAKTAGDTDPVLKISSDVGTLRIGYVVGIFCSEFIASCTGCCVGIIFKSTYAILLFLLLVLKLITLMFCVRRQCLVWPISSTTKAAKDVQFKDDIQKLELSRERDTDDFMLIRGSKLLLHQFSHNYGHPLRDGTGFFTSDRTN